MLTKLRRRKMCEIHFSDDDIMINNFRLSPVHIISEPPYESEIEFDFYMDTGLDCYLLRIRNNLNNTITLCKHDTNYNDLICIVVEKLLLLNIDDELKCIISTLKNKEIPEKIYEQIVFDLKC